MILYFLLGAVSTVWLIVLSKSAQEIINTMIRLIHPENFKEE
jgi:hypothetical protein